MGICIKRITAETVDTPVGKANVIAYAYKPYGCFTSWGEKENNKMKRASGCYASQRMVNNGNHTGLGATVRKDGTVERVIVTDNRAYFDDVWQYEKAECVYNVDDQITIDEACLAITSWSWAHFRDNIVGGEYRPSVDRREYSAELIKVFADAFKAHFNREIYAYG